MINGQVSRSANKIRHMSTHTATWADFDLDGWADVFVGNERDNWVKNQPCQLFRNNRDGTFTDIASVSGVSSCGMDTHGDAGARMLGYLSKGVAVGDYNNDGRPDLYISNSAKPNALYRNDGDWRFTEVSKAAGADMRTATFPTWFFDFDNDGLLDILAAGYGTATYEYGSGDTTEELARSLTEGTPPVNSERLLRCDAFGVFGTTLLENIGYFHSSSKSGAGLTKCIVSSPDMSADRLLHLLSPQSTADLTAYC
jgi:hypothetical protein